MPCSLPTASTPVAITTGPRRMLASMVAAAGATALLLALLQGCASTKAIAPDLLGFDESHLPAPDVTLRIPGLEPCNENPDRTLRLNGAEPLTVLVHGCFGSSGQFRGLAQVLAFHGQQAACFTYDDRDSMVVSSAQLARALERLAQETGNRNVTVIGHSQGALVARKALVADRPDALAARDLDLRLVTVSGPFSGIAAANQCGNPLTRVLTLGLIAPMCQIATGDKWSEITYTSRFILEPGALLPAVRDYLKIETDERGACRQFADGRCIESDDVFSLAEQRNAAIDSDAQTRIVTLKSGHVEIVGDQRAAPVKLIAVLQQNGVLSATAVPQQAAFDALLSRLYVRPGLP